MKNFWNKSLLLSGALALAVSVSPFSHAQSANPRLFEIDEQSDPHVIRVLQNEAGTYSYLGTLMDDPSIEQLRLVKVNAALIAPDTQMLSLPLPDGRTVDFQLKRFNTSMPGMEGWIGDVLSDRKRLYTSDAEVDMDPFNWVSLVRDGDQLAGSIRVDGQLYRLEFVGQGQHALTKVDESKLPPTAEPLPDPETLDTDTAVDTAVKPEHSTIRLLFVTTIQSRAAHPGIRATLAQALQNANQYMINSRVPINYELAGFYDADYDETGRTYKQTLDDMRLSKPFGVDLLRVREALGADLVSMYTMGKEYCGLAWIRASKAQGHSVISCAGALAHELGHNLGGNHGLEGTDPTKRYNHGYRHRSPNFHTIQVTSHGAIPYFSNPRLTYQGIPMGTVMNHDMARQFDDYRAVVENFYPPVLDVTLYEHSHYRGRSCHFIQAVGSAIDVRQQCGAEWGSIVSSAKVLGLAPGITVRFEGAPGQYEEFISKAYRGALSVYLFGEYPDMSSDIDWVKAGSSMNDKVSMVSISR